MNPEQLDKVIELLEQIVALLTITETTTIQGDLMTIEEWETYYDRPELDCG